MRMIFLPLNQKRPEYRRPRSRYYLQDEEYDEEPRRRPRYEYSDEEYEPPMHRATHNRIGYRYEYDDEEPRMSSRKKMQAKVQSMPKQMMNDVEDMTAEGERFLEILQEVFEETPETWKQYPATQDGRLAIMDMEFKEFKQALSQNKDKNAICKELMHVVGACFYMYKELTDE